MSEISSRFVVASAKAGREIVERLGAELRLGRAVTTSHRRTYLDSFDGRLYRAGLVLVAEPRGPGVLLRLEDLAGKEQGRAAAERLPGLRQELPAGPLGDRVRRRLGIRRLLPLAAADLRRRTWRVLDGEEKTLVRLVLETGHARGEGGGRKRLAPVLRAEALRGYAEEHRRVAGLLRAEPATAPDQRLPVDATLQAAGETPGGYSSKPRLALDPGQRSDAAVKQVLLGLLGCIEANEPGVRRDLDTEFLHDFRVAVRRSRSILGQLRGVFPARSVARFRGELKWLGNVTGPLRDLDVFLLEMPELAGCLPSSETARLRPLREFLEHRRRAAHEDLVRELDSARYRRLLASWRRFLLRPVPRRPARALGGRPIRTVAAGRVWEVYRKIRRRGRSIGPESPPDPLHRLRIGCKKLRYLLEFFGSLFDPAEVQRLVKALKRLQDNLGAFNDAVVQAATLRRFAAEMVENGAVTAAGGESPAAGGGIDETLLVMGRLIDQLDGRREAQRRAFAKRWRRFDSPRNRVRFRRLFKTAARECE